MTWADLFLYGAPVAAIAGFLLSPWGQPALAVLTGTRVGRYAAGAAAVAYAAFVVWSSTYRAGKRAGAADALRDVERANAAAVARHEAIEARVARTPDQALRDELKRWAPVLLVGLMLGGCVTSGTGGAGRGGAWCDVERPIRLSAERVDAMSAAEVKAAVAHNRHGQAECGWAPGREVVNASSIGSGEVLVALLVIALPLIAIGTLVWKQADRTRGMQASIDAAAEKAGAASDGVKRIEGTVSSMRDELHRDYVRQDALRDTEARISKRMDDVEHTVRGTATQIIAALTGSDAPPRRRRTQP